eukprot:3995529-Lingulodinium_polyedra.AAC.1
MTPDDVYTTAIMTTWPTAPLILGRKGRGARFTQVPNTTSPWNLAHLPHGFYLTPRSFTVQCKTRAPRATG